MYEIYFFFSKGKEECVIFLKVYKDIQDLKIVKVSILELIAVIVLEVLDR